MSASLPVAHLLASFQLRKKRVINSLQENFKDPVDPIPNVFPGKTPILKPLWKDWGCLCDCIPNNLLIFPLYSVHCWNFHDVLNLRMLTFNKMMLFIICVVVVWVAVMCLWVLVQVCMPQLECVGQKTAVWSCFCPPTSPWVLELWLRPVWQSLLPAEQSHWAPLFGGGISFFF